MESLMPIATGGMGFGGSAGIGGAIGGFIGSLFGNGFGGNSWGGDARHTPVVVEGMGGAGLAANAALDDLSAIQTSINGLGLSMVQGQNASNMALCQGFSGVTASATNNSNMLLNALSQGFSGVNNSVVTGNASLQSSLCQGFGGLSTQVLSSSKDNALLSCQSTNAITSSIDNCCCTTQKTIMAEGCATRELIKDVQTQGLRDQLCDAKSKISQLESQGFTSQAVANLGAQMRGEMAANTHAVIQHVAGICGGCPVTPAASK